MARKKEKEEALDAAAEEALDRVKLKKEADAIEKKRFDKAAKIFGSPEWVQKNVIPLGERGVILWRHLKATWDGKNERIFKHEWDKFSKDLKKD